MCVCVSRTGRGDSQDGAARKWQVQNVVGGGSLYGVSDTAQLDIAQSLSMSTDHTHPLPLSTAQGEGSVHSGRSLSPGRSDAGRTPGPFSTAYLEHRHSGMAALQGQHSGAGSSSAQQGGGGLSARPSSSGAAGPPGSGGSRRAMEGVDVLYLKNVLLKFLEAALAGRIPERDALLPAVATLLHVSYAPHTHARIAHDQATCQQTDSGETAARLALVPQGGDVWTCVCVCRVCVQATPSEYQVLKKVVNNTTPPAAQVLSWGMKLPSLLG